MSGLKLVKYNESIKDDEKVKMVTILNLRYIIYVEMDIILIAIINIGHRIQFV